MIIVLTQCFPSRIGGIESLVSNLAIGLGKKEKVIVFADQHHLFYDAIYDNQYKDKIIVNSFEKFTQWQLVFDHPNFKPKDIINLLNYAYREYYLNPKWIIKFIKDRIKDIYEGISHRLFRFSR